MMITEYINGLNSCMSQNCHRLDEEAGENETRRKVIEFCRVMLCYVAAISFSLLLGQLH